jgi:hypothetical protein
MEMKDVATKLKDWHEVQLELGYGIKNLIDLQLNLQDYFYRNSNGKDGKVFPDFRNVDKWS